jgi:tetrahydromethanopterin S-methyltransferase subunit B
MKKLVIGLGLMALLALLLASVSCAREAPEPPTTYLPPEEGWTEPQPPVLMPPAAPGFIWDSGANEGKGTVVLVNTEDIDERMIVRSGNISLVAEDVNQAMQAITQLATGYNGYVVSSSVSGEEEGMRGWIAIRVPDDKFDQAMAEIRGLAVRVEEESTSSQDVTEEYIDLEARLANAEATEQEFLALLDKAEDVDDILKIYNSLSQVRQEIEQIKGRMQYLERTSSMSLISVSLRPEFDEKPPVPPGWNALAIFKSAARGLVITGQVLGTIAIWLLIFIPIWGTILGIILWRLHKRRVRG